MVYRHGYSRSHSCRGIFLGRSPHLQEGSHPVLNPRVYQYDRIEFVIPVEALTSDLCRRSAWRSVTSDDYLNAPQGDQRDYFPLLRPKYNGSSSLPESRSLLMPRRRYTCLSLNTPAWPIRYDRSRSPLEQSEKLYDIVGNARDT